MRRATGSALLVVSTALALALVAACAETKRPPPASDPTPGGCEAINRSYREAVAQTSCAAAADCSKEVTGDLFCFSGPFRVNPRETTKLDALAAQFSAGCTALPCTPAAHAWTTTCERSRCATVW
jgi:hypothetical protein